MAKNIELEELNVELKESIAHSKALLVVTESILETVGKTADELSKYKTGLDLKNAKDLEAFNTVLEQTAVLTKERSEADKRLAAEQKKLAGLIKKDLDTQKKVNKVKKEKAELTDEEIRQSIITRKDRAERKKQIEAELILEKKSIRNKQDLQDQLKALRIEGSKLDLGSDELKANNDLIDELTDKLSNNSDQFVKNKINIGNYKSATEGLTLSFEDQKKKLDILTAAYQDAVAQGKKGKKSAKELKKELDAQKESLEDVKEALEDVEDASKKVGAASKALGLGLIVAVIAKITEFFGTSREASLEASIQFANFTESVKVFFAALVKAWDGAKIIFQATSESIARGFNRVQIGFNQLLLSVAEAKNFFGDYSGDVAKLKVQISALTVEQKALSESSASVADGMNKVKEAFKGVGETTSESIQAQKEFLKLQQKTEISIERQTRALAGLAEKRQILQDISDDDTTGFLTRAIAIKKAQIAAEQFAAKEERLAKTKERLTIEAIKQDLRVTGLLSKSRLDAIKSGEQLNTLLLQRGVALKVSSENEAAFTEAFTERIDKQLEREAFQRDQREKNRKTNRDGYEQEVDILEEFAEIQFARNESLIDSDKLTNEQRIRVLKDNEKISRELIDKTTDLTIKQAKSSIDLNADLTESEREVLKAKLDGLDIDKLVNLEESTGNI